MLCVGDRVTRCAGCRGEHRVCRLSDGVIYRWHGWVAGLYGAQSSGLLDWRWLYMIAQALVLDPPYPLPRGPANL